jgi:hypothetical protein
MRAAASLVVPLTPMLFDVLSVEGGSVIQEPYSERRRILEMAFGGGRGEGLAAAVAAAAAESRRRGVVRSQGAGWPCTRWYSSVAAATSCAFDGTFAAVELKPVPTRYWNGPSLKATL